MQSVAKQKGNLLKKGNVSAACIVASGAAEMATVPVALALVVLPIARADAVPWMPAACNQSCRGSVCASFREVSCNVMTKIGCSCEGCCRSPLPRPPPSPSPPPPSPPQLPASCHRDCRGSHCLDFRDISCDILTTDLGCDCTGCCDKLCVVSWAEVKGRNLKTMAAMGPTREERCRFRFARQDEAKQACHEYTRSAV